MGERVGVFFRILVFAQSDGVSQHGFAVFDADKLGEFVAVDASAGHGGKFGRCAEEIDVLADVAAVNGGIEVADFLVFDDEDDRRLLAHSCGGEGSGFDDGVQLFLFNVVRLVSAAASAGFESG